jgi:hypothetical protein
VHSEATKSTYAAPNRKLWVYGLLVATVLGALAYFGLLSQKDRSVNHDYYRVLYEASNTFNENLLKLDSMHKYKESVSSIRSLLPSYSRTWKNKNEKGSVDAESLKTFQYKVVGTSLFVTSPENESFEAKLAIGDILPQPKKGFSQFLFANENDVLAMVGAERTISIVELDSINKQIQAKNKQFQFNFSDTKASASKSGPAPLPTYSNHVDMKISYGEFRVYIFPFTLKTPLHQGESGENSAALDRLYLVGLLPQSKLSSRGSGDWNMSLLIVSLSSLLFMWCMLRLYLLPKNQSITKTFRVLVAASSYLFFIVLIALVLAYFQKTVLETKKDNLALHYAKNIETNLARDVHSVFSDLASFRTFYYKLISAIYVIPKAQQESGEFTDSQITSFNRSVKDALLSLHDSPCKDDSRGTKIIRDRMPGTAGTAMQQYNITYDCNLGPKDEGFVNIELDSKAILTIINASKSSKDGQATLDFYANNQSLKLVSNESLETSIKPSFDRTSPNKILSVFALNREGNSVLPSVNYQEGNSLPETFNLSHRNYYKRVRDHKGWDITIPKEYLADQDNPPLADVSYKNIYMQRLLNVNNGTRGTTISMPIVEPSLDKRSTKTLDYIMGADVLLPSLSLGKAPPYDFVYMVVDRSSGEVLFHNDSSRSLVENLYFSGDTKSSLSKWLKAGLDHYKELSKGLIEGVYHGQDGRFAVSKTIVDRWAVVVFYPNDSLQTFMTNQFLYIATTFVAIIGFMVLVIFTVRRYVWTSTLKRKLHLPTKLNVRLIMLVSSLLFGAGYCFYIVGYNLETLIFEGTTVPLSLIVPFVGLAIATYAVYVGCYNHFCYPLKGMKDKLSQASNKTAKEGSKRLIAAVLIAVGVHFIYLQQTADAPHKSLDFHYQQLACNWLNYEREELTSIGLSRYPNSITSSRISPLDLLPIDDSWRKRLKRDMPSSNSSIKAPDNAQTVAGSYCDNHSSQVHPDDYPSLSSVFGGTYLWQWINIYILDKELAVDYVPFYQIDKDTQSDISVSSSLFNQTLLFSFLLGIIAIMWFRFNTKIVWNKMYCPERFLQHIQNMTRSVHQLDFEERATNLVIECDTIKLNGIGLALLLRTMSIGKTHHANNLLDGFDELFELSPCLQKFSADGLFLPNLKLNIMRGETAKDMEIELWDIETCLEKSEFRQPLLDLIMELKSLTLSQQLAKFTIFTGFHSLQRVKMKDPLMTEKNTLLDHAEYLSWAECLMDFMVSVPDSFMQGIDFALLKEEVDHFPELAFIAKDVAEKPQEDDWDGVFKRDEELLLESRWATINYILLNAEALYRFKWESCSSAEKLALINLAKQQRINPANTQMIEHLALNGLITVRKGNLDIINRSFAHFVLHAETAETLNQLIAEGEAGVWKNYKLPLGLLIVLIIGGIALTSGESIYIIAASMAGILGTIASVTNSANLLRGQVQD